MADEGEPKSLDYATPGETPGPLDYATRPRPPVPVAKPAWRPGEERKALAEGCGAMLLLPVLVVAGLVAGLVVLLFLVVIVAQLLR